MLQLCNTIKVLEVFFREPTEKHYLIEISRKSKLAHTSVKAHLNTLVKRKIINRSMERKGKRKFPYFVVDPNSLQFKRYKSAHNLLSVYNSGLVEFLRDKCMPKSIVMFGSYLIGEDTESSDIDLFVETKKQDIDLAKYEKNLGRKIELLFNKDFKDYSSELKNNIINGRTLYGYLEAFG